MDIVTLGAAKSQTESYVESHFVAGSNIIIESNLDGTQTISASGEVSSEDTVARAAINAIKDGTTIDSFGDVESALATKVDKVSGKGLSTNDFTNTLKTKLDDIASGAEVNVQSDWTQTDNTADDYIKNKPTLGTAAAADTTDFATAAQGTKADSAVQSAGSGLSKSGTTLNHSNSVTAKTTQALRKTSFDAQGHITGSSELSTAESDALASGINSTKVAQIETNKNNILSIENSIIKMVAHTSANGTTSLSYETNINDFAISGGANSDKSSGSYLVICTNWSTTPAPYIGLLTFSGATSNSFVKTDIVTGFSPTITITQNVANATIDISGAAKISIYALR